MQGTAAAAKRTLVGGRRAIPQQRHELLPRWAAMPIVSANPLSSVVYASHEMILVLAVAGAAGLAWTVPLAAAVAALLLVVVAGYRRAVRAYPHGAGAYLATRDNLGRAPGAVAGAALLVNQVLTVAVSVVAGAAALVAAFPDLAAWRMPMALVLLALVMIGHLRGGRQASLLLSAPTYAFVAALVVLLAVGAVRCGAGIGGCPAAGGGDLQPTVQQPLAALLVLRAFTVGAVVLAGVESAGNGVSAFRYPQTDKAVLTLGLAGVVTAVAFVGVVALASATGAVVARGAETTVIAELTTALLGGGAPLVVVQLATAAVLLVAASTALSDFPRVASVLARDGWLPRQLSARGDRLTSANGVLLLTAAAGTLVVAFDGRLAGMVALYVLAAFTVFACTHAGMVRHALGRRVDDGLARVFLHGAAAAASGLVAAAAVVTGFGVGVAAVLATTAALVAVMMAISREYRALRHRLETGDRSAPSPQHHDAVILLHRVDEPAARALSWLQRTRPRSVTALAAPDPGADLGARWEELSGGLPLELVAPASSGDAADRLVAAVAARRRPDAPTTVVLAEELARSWTDQLLGHRLELGLKGRLRTFESLAVADVTSPSGGPGPYTVEEPADHHVLVLVSSVHAGTLRALRYAQLLSPTSLRAMSVSVDPRASARLLRQWSEWEIDTPLEIVDSPFRSLTYEIRRAVRRFAPDGRQSVVTIVLSELMGLPAPSRLLHGQSATAIRNALLFERGAITITVPHHLHEARGPAEGQPPPSGVADQPPR